MRRWPGNILWVVKVDGEVYARCGWEARAREFYERALAAYPGSRVTLTDYYV